MAVSPLIGGSALKGPAHRILAGLGYGTGTCGGHRLLWRSSHRHRHRQCRRRRCRRSHEATDTCDRHPDARPGGLHQAGRESSSKRRRERRIAVCHRDLPGHGPPRGRTRRRPGLHFWLTPCRPCGLADGDILVVTHKVVSKAEGAMAPAADRRGLPERGGVRGRRRNSAKRGHGDRSYPPWIRLRQCRRRSLQRDRRPGGSAPPGSRPLRPSDPHPDLKRSRGRSGGGHFGHLRAGLANGSGRRGHRSLGYRDRSSTSRARPTCTDGSSRSQRWR